MRPVLRRLLTLKRDDSAATAVEFALLITPLVALILASLQLSIVFFAGQQLQSVAMAASRELMTGTAQKAGENQTQYHSDVCAKAPSLFVCNDIMVDVQSGSAYNQVNTTPITITYDKSFNVTNKFAYSTGNPGDIIILRVMYNWPVFGAGLIPGIADQPNGAHLLVATSVFKTEPY